MDNRITHFTQLVAWKKNHDLLLSIYRITKKYPREEMFGLTSQTRRAASSITANIAEGYGRFHSKDKARFYLQARGSSSELQNHLILAKDLRYIFISEFEELNNLCIEGYKIICGLINSTNK